MSATTIDDRPNPIALLNDRMRRTLSGGKIMMTDGVASLPESDRAAALQALRSFDTFDADNDPNGEHDFGSFEVTGQKLFFQFAYYDLNYEYASDDPANTDKTRRVLTLMRADEY